MWQEFKDFIIRGNLVEIAVAFVMGAAFGALVKSFIGDVIMPVVGKLVGNVDFASLYTCPAPRILPPRRRGKRERRPSTTGRSSTP